MKYEKRFTKPYPNGYKDKPDLTTPVKAHILNMQDDTFEAIEDFLANLDVSTDLPDNVVIKESLTVGSSNRATDSNTVSHGADCEASSPYSHAEGISCVASGQASHAEGINTKASEYMAHSEGNITVAGGAGSHAEGYGTKATANFQHVQGKYNVEDTEKKYAHIVGGGSSDYDRKNIHTIDWNGNAEFAGDVKNGNGVSLDGLDGKIAELASSGISRLIVDSLPTENIKTNVIYFLPLSSVGENNIYEEYMYINDKWELIGTTQVDLSQYYTKEESDNLLAEKADKTDFENHANDKDIHVTVAEKEKWNTEDIADVEVADYLTVENSVAGGLKLNQLYGKSEQKKYSGKNLLKVTLGNITKDGVTCTNNGDGTYTLNGTATNSIDFLLATMFSIVKDKNYRVTGALNYKCRIYLINGSSAVYDTGKGISFVYSGDSTSNKAIHFLIDKGITLNNIIVKPMIVDASLYPDTTYDDFEPYVGGIPSPNPDYPQEIKTVINPTMKVTGKNLFDNSLMYNPTETAKWIQIQLRPNTNYVASSNIPDFLSSAYFFVIGGTEIGTANSVNNGVSKSKSKKVTSDSNGVISIAYRTNGDISGKPSTIEISDYILQIELGDIPTKPIEPHVSQTVALTGVTLNAIPVPNDGNVTIDGQQYISDYVDVERGKIVRMVARIVLDGSSDEVWNLVTGTNNFFEIKPEKVLKYHSEMLCNIAIATNNPAITASNSSIGISVVGNNSFRYRYEINNDLTLNDLIEKLSSNPMVVYAELETPTEESLTADQLSALQALQTYYSQTNVFVTSEELPPMVELEYGLNKVGGYTLEALNTARANAVKLNSFLSSQNESENTTNEQE